MMGGFSLTARRVRQVAHLLQQPSPTDYLVQTPVACTLCELLCHRLAVFHILLMSFPTKVHLHVLLFPETDLADLAPVPIGLLATKLAHHVERRAQDIAR